MADIHVEADWLAPGDCRSVSDQNLYDTLRDHLGLGVKDEIAFALLVVDNGIPGTVPRYLLLTSPQRRPVDVSWNWPHQTYFPPDTQATPQNGDVLVVTYPGSPGYLYKGICTKIGGIPVWF
jgi:hypothetical protein